MIAKARQGLAAVGALAMIGLVAVAVHAPGPADIVLAQGETIVDQINDKFMARMEKKQHDADELTVKDAAHVNQLFGGSFSDGVGSNTWAHTPYQKYDYKDPAHMQSLAEVSPEQHAELVKCMQLAQAFKGAKAGHFKVTEAQKIEAMKCMHVARKKAEAKKLSIDTSLAEPKMKPNEVHIYKPPKAVLERRAKIEKAEMLRAEKLEKAKEKARQEAMHPHIIKAHHFFPKGLKKKAAGVEGKILKEANKARKELSARLHKMPAFAKTQSFDGQQGARKRNTKDISAKLAFWEGIGSVKEDRTSRDRSKTEYVVTDAYAGARKAQKTSALLQQHTTMLFQNPDINARPYYTADNMGPKSQWSGYGQELAKEQDGGNPYAKGWRDLKMNQGVEGVYQQINKNLEPLAEQYPYMRAIRHRI